MKKLSNDVTVILDDTLELVKELKHNVIGVEHIFLSLVKNNKGLINSIKPGITFDEVKDYVNIARKYSYTNSYIKPGDLESSVDCKVLIDIANDIAEEYNSEKIEVTHLLLAILQTESEIMNQLLKTCNIKKEESSAILLDMLHEISRNNIPLSTWKPLKNVPKSLDASCKDMTKMAYENKIDPVLGRSEEIERVIQILCRRIKNNPVLVGPAGTGKTSIVEGLAQRIVQGNVPAKLKDANLFVLDMGTLISGAKYRGEFEERIKTLIDEVTDRDDIILFIDEVHTIVGAGSTGDNSIDASNLLKPALARGEIKVIGATTFDEYSRYIEKDKALERRFQKVNVEEPNVEATREILNGIKFKYEEYHNVIFSSKVVEKTIELSNKYITSRHQPDKSIDLMDEVCSRVSLSKTKDNVEVRRLQREINELNEEKKKLIKENKYNEAARKITEIEYKEVELGDIIDELEDVNNRKVEVTEEDVAKVVEMWTGIPATKMMESETAKLSKLEEILHKRVIGQNEAIEAVSKAIRRNRTGLGDPKKPIGTFFFAGPSGVGKQSYILL